MSVDVYIGVAYGIGGSFEDLEDLPGKLKSFEWDDLYEGLHYLPDGVEVSIGGNQMDGDRRWSLIVASTARRVDKHGLVYPEYEIEVLHKMLGPTKGELEALTAAQNELELEDYAAGWLFTVDVS